MVALMLGLTFTHMACQKFSAKKHSLVVQVRPDNLFPPPPSCFPPAGVVTATLLESGSEEESI